MRYSELLSLGSTREGRVPMEALSALKETIPEDVLEQFLYDHALNPDFQKQYGHLDLSRIVWELCCLPASEIVQASTYHGFRDWPRQVAARLNAFAKESWACIDRRPYVVNHWATHHTWLRAPVMLDGRLLRRSSRLHLAEGHTRLGLLRGLVSRKILSPESRHDVWIGRPADAPSG